MAAYTTDKGQLVAELTSALKKRGVILPDEAKSVMADFVLERLGLQRERLACIVDSLASMYDELNQEQMDTLSRLIREHVVDRNGNICLQDD